MSDIFLRAALYYVTHLHWAVFPLQEKSKVTLALSDLNVNGEGGFKVASVDPEKIREWWTRWPNSNIGIATGAISNIVVLDIDPGHGGESSLIHLKVEYGDIPKTLEVRTGGGGRHIFFAHPGVEIRNSAGKLAPGLDIRGDGGYIVAPPSVHPSGGVYGWISDIGNATLAPMPAWMVKKLAEKPAEVPAQMPGMQGKIVSGARNATLASLAGSMRRRGQTEESILAALLVENRQRCFPPLSEHEVQIIAKSIARYDPKEVHTAAAPVRSAMASKQEGDVTELRPPMNAYEGIAAFLELLDNLDGRSIKTYIPPLDNALGGLERQTVSVLAARPSMGKSTLAWQIARNVAAYGLKSYMFSLEMSTTSLWAKAACGMTEIAWKDVRSGKIAKGSQKWNELVANSMELAKRYGEHILVDDGVNDTRTVWESVFTYRPDLIVLDHLGLLSDSEGENQNIRLGEMTKNLKAIAKEFNCHCMILHQLSRDPERRAEKRPMLADLRESGHIEQDADLVLMMYREDYYKGEEGKPVSNYSKTEVLPRKFRDGATDIKIELYLDKIAQFFILEDQVPNALR